MIQRILQIGKQRRADRPYLGKRSIAFLNGIWLKERAKEWQERDEQRLTC